MADVMIEALARGAVRPKAVSRTAWDVRYVWMLLLFDTCAVLIADLAAYNLRLGLRPQHNPELYLVATLLLPIVWLAVLALNHAYETRYLFVGTEEYQRVLRAGVAVTASLALIAYGFNLDLARGYVVIAIPLALSLCLLARFGLRRSLHRAWGRGKRLRRVLVVGHARGVDDLCLRMTRARYHGLEVVGACVPAESNDYSTVPVYGTFEDVPEAVDRANADTVMVLACPELNGPVLRRLGWRLERDDVDLIVASALMEVAGYRTTIRPVDGLPMLHVDHARLGGARRVVKELVDRIGAVLLLTMSAPVLLIIAAIVRLSSPGPALFRQIRVGRDGREFSIYKFRTMRADAEQLLEQLDLARVNEHDGVLFKIKNDPRITRIGAFLRRCSLDELPQLINVLRGEMSLVGPRPPLPSEVLRYPADMRRRLVVKPGMTGLWQVSGRSDLPWEEVMRLDLRYVENWSLSLDVAILLRTVTAVWRSSGAY